MNTTFIIYFRNHDTFLCIFNYKVDAEIARYWKLKLHLSFTSVIMIRFYVYLTIR